MMWAGAAKAKLRRAREATGENGWREVDMVRRGQGGHLDLRLAEAARAGDAKQVSKLLKLGANPLAEAVGGNLAIGHAAWSGKSECARLLADAGGLGGLGWRMAVLRLAAIAGNVECLRILATPEAALHVGAHGRTLLMVAAFTGSAGCVRELAPWSDPLAADAEGMTALMRAAMKGHGECVEALLPISDLAAVDACGMGAERLARANGHASVGQAIGAYSLAMEEARELAAGCPQGSPGKRSHSI